jgi:hypothetical protein
MHLDKNVTRGLRGATSRRAKTKGFRGQYTQLSPAGAKRPDRRFRLSPRTRYVGKSDRPINHSSRRCRPTCQPQSGARWCPGPRRCRRSSTRRHGCQPLPPPRRLRSCAHRSARWPRRAKALLETGLQVPGPLQQHRRRIVRTHRADHTTSDHRKPASDL